MDIIEQMRESIKSKFYDVFVVPKGTSSEVQLIKGKQFAASFTKFLTTSMISPQKEVIKVPTADTTGNKNNNTKATMRNMTDKTKSMISPSTLKRN